MTQRSLLSFVYFALAGAWPIVVNAAASALISPLQRAMRDAYCGTPHAGGWELLGHCAACWGGSALLLAAGLFTLMSSEPSALAAPTRR